MAGKPKKNHAAHLIFKLFLNYYNNKLILQNIGGWFLHSSYSAL